MKSLTQKDRAFIQQLCRGLLSEDRMRKFGPHDPSWGASLVSGESLVETFYYQGGDSKDAVARLVEKCAAQVQASEYTLYLSLEPSAIYGKLPPVTESIRKLGVKRIVIGALSPLPKQRGEGIRVLESFAPEVLVMDGEEALLSQEVLVDFEKWLRTGLPSLVAYGSCRKKGEGWEFVLDKDCPFSSPPGNLVEPLLKSWALENEILRAAVKDVAQIPKLLQEHLIDRVYLHKENWKEEDFQLLTQASFVIAGSNVYIDGLRLSRAHPDFLEANLRLC